MLLRASTALVSFVVALEIALRIYNPFPFRVRGDRIVLPIKQRYVFAHAGATKLEPVNYVAKNSLGFRGPEPPRDWPRWFTILTVGGSTTECLFLSDGKTWTDRFARRAAALRPDVWVNNAGLDGHSTFGHIVLLRDYLASMHPKLLIFLIGVNDVSLASPRSWDRALDPGNFSAAHRVGTLLADHSEVASLAWNLERMARTYRARLGDGEVHLKELKPRPIDDATVAATVAAHQSYVEAFGRRIDEILELCRTNGIEAVLMTQPALSGDAIDPTTGVALGTAAIEPLSNGHVTWVVQELYNDTTRQRAAAAGVQLIDLAREVPKDSRFFSDWIHYTNEGAALIGDLVFRHLESRLAPKTHS